jgi:hypothetical protein
MNRKLKTAYNMRSEFERERLWGCSSYRNCRKNKAKEDRITVNNTLNPSCTPVYLTIPLYVWSEVNTIALTKRSINKERKIMFQSIIIFSEIQLSGKTICNLYPNYNKGNQIRVCSFHNTVIHLLNLLDNNIAMKTLTCQL